MARHPAIIEDIEHARHLAYLPILDAAHPSAIGGARLHIEPNPASTTLRGGVQVVQGTLSVTGPGTVHIRRVNWAGLAGCLLNRDDIERSLLGARLSGPQDTREITLLIDSTLTAATATEQELHFDYDFDGHVLMSLWSFTLLPLYSDRIRAHPPQVDFGIVWPIDAFEVPPAPVDFPGAATLRIWSAVRGEQQFGLVAGWPLRVSCFAEGEVEACVRIEPDNAAYAWPWPLGHCGLSPIGYSRFLHRASTSRRLFILCSCANGAAARVVHHPEWLEVTPDVATIDGPLGAAFDLRPTPGGLRRGIFRGRVEFEAADERVQVPVSLCFALPGPLLRVDPPELDFGAVAAGQSAACQIQFINDGTGQLDVQFGDADSPVGEAQVHLESRDERIRRACSLLVVLHTNRLPSHGPVEFDVPIRSNSIILGQEAFSLRARAHHGHLTCDPADLADLRIAPGDLLEICCRLRHAGQCPVELESIGAILAGESPWRLSVRPCGGERFEIQLQAPTSLDAEPVRAKLQVRERLLGLQAHLELAAHVVAAKAELQLVINDSTLRPVTDGAILSYADVRRLSLQVHNRGSSRLLVEGLSYERTAGPRLFAADVPCEPVAAGASYVSAVRAPLAFVWWPRRGYTIKGTFALSCRHNLARVAALPINVTVRRQR